MRTVTIKTIGVLGLLLTPFSAFGQDADFTFKRVPVPQAGTTRRITVQIDPAEQARARAALEQRAAERAAEEAAKAEADVQTAEADDTPKSGYEWFWASVSPALDEAGPANVMKALETLTARADLQSPRLQTLQDIAKAYGPDILLATIGTDISPALVVALISVESSGSTTAESEKGAMGLMQLIPATAERFGVTDATDPSQNIKGGVKYLGWLMKHFGRDPILTLAGYNAGENAVTKHGGVPPYAETRAYVPKVLAAWQVARGLCLTPPELMTDGCVFAVNGV